MSKQKKKNIILFSILIVVAAITFWVLWGPKKDGANLTQIFSLSTQPSSQIETQKLPSKQIFEQSLDQDLRFSELKNDSQYQPNLDAKGRDNPFVPIQ